MARVSRVQHKKKALVEALEKSLGVVTSACKAVGVDRGTFYNYYKDDPEFRAEVDAIDNIALDFAESQLHRQIQEGNTAATIFYLKTKGKKRGYIERTEQDVSLQGEVATRVILPEDDAGDS